VWCDSEQRLPFADRFVYEMELALFQIPDAAVNQPRRTTRGPAREVVTLDEGDTQPAHRGVARDTTAGNASSDYEKVE
jgi:hypothetical protein